MVEGDWYVRCSGRRGEVGGTVVMVEGELGELGCEAATYNPARLLALG